MKTGTLKELSVKPGDVVQCAYEGTVGTVKSVKFDSTRRVFRYDVYGVGSDLSGETKVNIISRLVGETPKRWEDMTRDEKAMLLLAQHEGGRLQRYSEHRQEWVDASLSCGEQHIYRVKPEPVRGMVELPFANSEYGWFQPENMSEATHRITFDTIDGEPDCDSITMEKL